MNSDAATRPLRWYLLLWVCLGYLWGFIALWTNGVAAGWNACQRGQGTLESCQHIKQLLRGPVLPTAAAYPEIVLPSLLAFTLMLLLYGVLLCLALTYTKQRRLCWLLVVAQGLVVFGLGFVTPEVGVAVPLGLYLALILEVSAIFKQALPIVAVSCGALLLLVLTWHRWEVAGVGPAMVGAVEAVVLFVIGFLFVLGFLFSYLELARAHARLGTAHVQLQALAEQIESLTLVTERQRMARELHDTLAQGLAGIILQLEVAHARLGEHQPETAAVIMRQTLATARETLADARGAIDDLRASTASATDPTDAVCEVIHSFANATGIPCECDLAALTRVAPASAEHLARMVSECLRNVARHARAHQAWVRTTRDARGLLVEVGDDGIGFEPALVMQEGGHYGLLGLRERARLMGGRFNVISAPGRGTTVQLHVPEREGI